MEKAIETPSTSPIQVENTTSEYKTPPQSQDQESEHQNSQDSGNDLRKTSTPDSLKVPKAFKYSERYRSPTDSMMSPVSKGLLARNRKGGALLPPSLNQPKIQELLVQNAGLFRTEVVMLVDEAKRDDDFLLRLDHQMNYLESD
ncbi:hypothetical protein Dsin_017168 [Dipteronia sinensis]|uniref:Uncharacterized protein n=1 Tax=Dipteronia sinensis TaxID=43782 RepID=A0AAE0AFT9_9ROSI|nr:hypothetical protein Dsin_017168 [Dipteronia sinensis]